MSRLIVGCGYLGLRVARRWCDAGQRVYVVTRSPARADELGKLGFIPLVADVTRPESLVGLPAADTVLYAVGFDRAAGKAMREVYVDGLQAVLNALPASTGRIVYISSTGVYGQGEGEQIDELSPCHPDRENGRICLEAEERLAAHPLGKRAIVLRLAGIYGPGRIPRRAALAAGEPIAAEGDACLNLIHVNDAASAVLAAEAWGTPPQMFLVSDGQPVLRRDFYGELARLISAPSPRFAPSTSSSQRPGSDKRIINARVVAELGLKFAYPGYREGLAAIVAAEF